MKTCPKCGNKYPDDKKFCIKDGTPLVEGTETKGYEMDPKDVAQKSVFEDKLKTDPLNVSILHEYAQFLFNKKIYKDAIVILHKILVIKEEDTVAQSLLYKSYVNINKPDEAYSFGVKLLDSNPNDEFLLADLGNIAYSRNKFEDALTYFNKSLSLNPNDKELWIKKATALIELKRNEEANPAWQHVYELDNENIQARFYCGINNYEKKDYTTAITLLEPIIDKIQNQDEKEFTKLYFCHSAVKLNRTDKASIRIFNSINEGSLKKLNDADLNIIYSDVLVYFGNLFLIESINIDINLSSANDCFTKALNFNKNSESAKTGLAECFYKKAKTTFEYKQFPNAKSYIEEALNIFPEKQEYQDLQNQINNTIGTRKKKSKIAVIAGILIIAIIIAAIYFINYLKQESAWNLAKTTNTFNSYLKYIDTYENGKYINKAKELQETALWNEVQKKNNIHDYDNYLSLYPNGRYVNEVKSKKEDEFWNETKKKNTIQDYWNYLNAFIDGKYYNEALSRKEDLIWLKTRKENTVQAYDNYVSDYKNGKYIKEAIYNYQKLGGNSSGLTNKKNSNEKGIRFTKNDKIYIRAFNIDDIGECYINGNRVMYVRYGDGNVGNSPGKCNWIEISAYLDKLTNIVNFKGINNPGCCGFSYGFQIKLNNKTIFNESKGWQTSEAGTFYNKTIKFIRASWLSE